MRSDSNSLLRFNPDGNKHPQLQVIAFSFLTFAALRSWWVLLPYVLDKNEQALFGCMGALQFGRFLSNNMHSRYPSEVRLFHAAFIFLAAVGCTINIGFPSTIAVIIIGMFFIGLASDFSYLPQPTAEHSRVNLLPLFLALSGCFTYLVSAIIFEEFGEDDDAWGWVAGYTLVLLFSAFLVSFTLDFSRAQVPDQIRVLELFQDLEPNVYWFFLMYIMTGFTDGVFFSLAAYVLQDKFDFSVMTTALYLGIAFVIPAILNLLREVYACSLLRACRCGALATDWKARFLIGYLVYLSAFLLFYFLPARPGTIIALQLVELTRVTIRYNFNQTLILETDFPFTKLTLSKWLYSVIFIASCGLNVFLFYWKPWLPFVVGFGFGMVGFVFGLYDYIQARFEIADTEDSIMHSGGEGSIHADPLGDAETEAYADDVSIGTTNDYESMAHEYTSLRHEKSTYSSTSA